MTHGKLCLRCKNRERLPGLNGKYCTQCTYEKNGIRSKIYTCNRRAEKLGVPSTLTVKKWIELCDYYGCVCLKCRKPGTYHTLSPDHVVPLALGGTGESENIQPLCRTCNMTKQTAIIDYRLCNLFGVEPGDILKREVVTADPD